MLEDYLMTILREGKFNLEELTVRPVLKSIKARDLLEDLKACYQRLGGKSNFPSFSFYCRMVTGKCIVILDDHAHFNRYRNLTLRSSLYDQIPKYPKAGYQRYCRSYEKECLKAGMREGVWSSGTAEKYFGPAAEPGDFFGNGATGWKLQAYKDYLRDLSAFSAGYTLIPVSVYDNLMIDGKLVKIETILNSRHSQHERSLLRYLERRMRQ